MNVDWERWAAIVGAVTGVGGLVTGGLGWRAANRSNAIAQTGNEIAVGANSKSDEANQLAREANHLAHHQDQRETESHDVRWEGDWIGPGRYALVTHGVHTAHAVVARVVVDDEPLRVERTSVAPGEQVIFDFPRARREFEQELIEYRRNRGRTASLAFPNSDPLRFRMHVIEEFVQWRTALGAVKEHENVQRLTTLGEFH